MVGRAHPTRVKDGFLAALSIFAAFFSGINLKRIVQIIMFPLQPGDNARDQVRRNEKTSPPLRLADVNLFVIAAEIQARRIEADDRMA